MTMHAGAVTRIERSARMYLESLSHEWDVCERYTRLRTYETPRCLIVEIQKKIEEEFITRIDGRIIASPEISGDLL